MKRRTLGSNPVNRTVRDVLKSLPDRTSKKRLKRQIEKRRKKRVPFKTRKILRRAKKKHPSFEVTEDGSIFLGTPHVHPFTEQERRHKPYFDRITSALRENPKEFEILLEAHQPELLLDELGFPRDVVEEVVMKTASKELGVPLTTFRSGSFSVETLKKLRNKKKASIAIASRIDRLIESQIGFRTAQEAREMILKGAEIKAGRLGIKPDYFRRVLEEFQTRQIPIEEIVGVISDIVDISNASMEKTIYNALKKSKARKFVLVVGDQHFSAAKRAYNNYLRERVKQKP